MKNISLKLKITLWYTLVMIILSTIVLFAVSSISRDMIEKDVSQRLVKSVNDFSAFLGKRNEHMRPMPMRGFYDKGVHLVVFNKEGNLSEGHMPFGISDKMTFSDDVLRKETYDGNLYFVYDKKTRELPDRTYKWVKGFVAFSEEHFALNTVMRNNVILTLCLIIFAAFGGYFIIQNTFVPINKIMKTANQIAKSNDLSRRIHIGKGNDEIHELANTFDQMLEKIEYSFEKEKQFTSDASHELRTPVAVILSECDYISECIVQDVELKESTETIKRQAEKMSKLISELLTISRMDRNTIKTTFEKTNISEVLSFVCDEQEDINPVGYTLIRDIEENIYAIVDSSLIARMFINLISNAYQYTAKNGIIKVTLKKENEMIVFRVEDNGIGIAEENLQKVFERFYQVDDARTTKSSGSMGLGLSMVKWICECHGGVISVKSKLGQGSVFCVELPANL